MSAGAPWSVKGIDPKAREVAKDLARRSGMTLGEWLNRVILEDDAPEDVTAESQIPERPRRASQEPPRLRAVPPPTDLARVAHALDRLTDRIEASETRTGLAISGVEHSVRQALARIEAAEREHLAVATRLDGAVEQQAGEQARLAERMRRLEAGPRSAEALRALEDRLAQAEAAAVGDPAPLVETVLERLGGRLAEAEARTAEALLELRGALAALDRRMAGLERGGGGDLERRFEVLAGELARRVEQARAEVAEKLAATSSGQVEARLAEMAEHVRAAERRSAHAIERMGKEVLNMAEALNRRLGASEQRSAEAIEQVGGEIARIAGAVEARLARAEHTQAEALERLGAEIGRATDRLSERLTASERRAAEAIDQVGEHVSRVAERIEQRHDRTARLLEEARGGAAPEAPRPALAPAEEPAPRGPFGPELFQRAEPAVEPAAPEPPRPSFTPEDFEAADGFAPLPDVDEDDVFELAAPEPAGPGGARPLSTREVIEQARAAARAAQGQAAARPVNVRAKVDRRAASGRLFNGFGSRPRRPSSPLQTALMVAGGAAFLSVGAAGVVLMEGPKPAEEGAVHADIGDAPRAAAAVAPAQAASAHAAPAPAAPPGAEAAFAEAVRLVEANRPGGLSRLKAVADQGYAPAQFYLAQLYESGRAGVVQNAAEARRWTARAAEGGEPSAMHNLGLYYFRGEGGPQDLASAALWFRKAASAGVVDSQYNLGLMYQSGSGVPKDLAEAYRWFSLAAGQGDGLAQAAAQALKAQVPAAAAKQTETAARGLTIPAAKQVLARLGYFKGAADDAATPEFKSALLAYQRDKGLPATGALDPKTAGLLSVYER